MILASKQAWFPEPEAKTSSGVIIRYFSLGRIRSLVFLPPSSFAQARKPGPLPQGTPGEDTSHFLHFRVRVRFIVEIPI